MFTSLDLIIIAIWGLIALTVLSVALLFLLKSPKAKRVFFYTVAVLGLYVASVGIRIGGTWCLTQSIIGVLLALAVIAAVVLERMAKENEKKRLIAHIAVAAALALALINVIV